MLTVWLAVGIGLIVFEIFLPELVAGPVGVAALLAAGLAWLGIPSWIQVVAWMGLSAAFILLGRRMMPHGTVMELEESREARSISMIPAGQRGRVAYQGSEWNAKCSIPTLEIPAEQDLYVVERQGNTLIVMPAKLLGD
ncbi:MAG: NfeD family protein [Synechococcaceae cyanobacterium SM2_3_2]|nr:NfeD family protein [Synechococcaceae cyanobacterium SM2_3_2]